ncbi:CHASE2 domain-containing protein, partial [Cribrihabitans sp. XS_ASV171]
ALWHPGDRSPFWQGIEGRLLDARFLWRGPLTPPHKVVILAFDDAAMARQEGFPPSRAALADVLTAARDAGAAVVALDFLLVSPRPDDRALSAALRAGNAILAVAEAPRDAPVPDLDGGGFDLVVAPDPGRPLPALGPAEALRGTAPFGHVVLTHDAEGAARRFGAARALM